MSVKRVKRKDIDSEKWDQAISNSYKPIMYALSWYLDTVSPNWEALIYGDYEVLMPLPIKKSMGVLRILQPPFTQQLGAFSRVEISEHALANLLAHLPKTSIKTDLQFHNNAQISGSTLRNNYLLSLHSSYQEIYKKYNQNTKRNLKRAVENDFIIKEEHSPSSIVKAFKESKAKTLNLSANFYTVFEQLCEKAKTHIPVQFYSCYLYKDFAAGICLFTFKGRSVFLFSATSNIGKSTGAMPFLIDWFIQKNTGKDLQLDFEGSDDVHLAQFYKGFGAVLHPYQRIKSGIL